MLILNENIDQKININVVNVDAPSDTKFYYDKLLTDIGVSMVNKPFDSELYEYKPKSQTVNYFIYFLSFKDKNFNQDVVSNLEPAFADYYNLAKSTLNTIHKGNHFDFLQNNDSLNIPTPTEMFKTAADNMLDKPYQIQDYVQEFNKLKPINPGLPLFYDSFTFPFSHNIGMWKDRANKYSDLPALYNSFLLLDFYTSPNASTQQKIMSLPIFVVDRYMMYEKSVNEVKQLRPTFLLQNGVEGYSIFFLQNFGINKLYVKYSFWDAMNGARIPLLASSINSSNKKGIQSVSKFDHRNEYIMLNLNFNDHTYRMYEFNNTTKSYDLQTYDFDLYELFYDDFWAGKVVKNTRPVALQEPSTYVVNFNQTIDLSINHTKIESKDITYTTPINQSTLDNYYASKYNDINGAGSYVKEYLKSVFTDLKTTKQIFPITKTTLFVNESGVESNTNCYQKAIDTITITNNNNDKVTLYDIFIGDIELTHTPIYRSNLIGDMKSANASQLTNINSKKKFKTGSQQQLLVENYVTYRDFGIVNKNNDLIGEMYRLNYDKFKSPYNIWEANAYNIIENIDFDVNNPKSLATYMRNGYIFGNYAKQKYASSQTGRGTGSGVETYFDSVTNYYSILRTYEQSDPNFDKLKFKNLSTSDRNKFLDTLLYVDKGTYGIKFAKDIDYEQNPAYWFTDKQINEDILVCLKDNDTAIKEIDHLFESLDNNKHKIWLRDTMIGFNINVKSDNFLLELNEQLSFDVNLLMGEQFIIQALNPNNPLKLTATIKVILADRFSNRKTYTIPVSYSLNIR